MAEHWFVRQDGKVFGPMSPAKLKSLADEGRVRSTSEVSNAAGGPWHPITRVKGLSFPAEQPLTLSPDELPPPPPSPRQAAPAHYGAASSQPSGNGTAERDIWRGRPSQLVNLKTYVVCAFLCIPILGVSIARREGGPDEVRWINYLYVIPAAYAAWQFLVILATRYELTSQRLRYSWGVLSRSTEEMELYRVKDTSFRQTIFQRMFGLATVHIVSSDQSTSHTDIRCIPAKKAKEIRETIRNLTEELRDRKRIREVDYV